MSPFGNQRRHRRFIVDVMELKSSAVFSSEVVIRDIGISGVSLITDRRLDVGSHYSISIIDGGRDIILKGEVIWCSESQPAQSCSDHAHLKYAAGMKFMSLSTKTVKSLRNFIEVKMIGKDTQVKVHDISGCRCSIRVLVDGREKAMLNVAETYRVKKLSLGGLLLESDHTFENETRLHMSIALTRHMCVTFVGRVASCIPSPGKSSHFDIGIQFIDMLQKDKMRLKEFIRRLYLEDAGFAVHQ